MKAVDHLKMPELVNTKYMVHLSEKEKTKYEDMKAELVLALPEGEITAANAASLPPEVPLRELPYNAVVELVNPVADTVSRKTYTGADVDWYVKAEDIVLKNKGNQNAGNPQNNNTQGQPKK